MYLRKIEEDTLILLNNYFKEYSCNDLDYCLTKTNGVIYIGINAFVITREDIPNYNDLFKSLQSLYNKGYIKCSKITPINNTRELPCFRKISFTNIGKLKTEEITTTKNIFKEVKCFFKKYF